MPFSEIEIASRDLNCSEATTESTSNGMLSWKQLVQGLFSYL